ncbi:MAG: 1-phosphofructokinase [Candidatus Avilachnospira sp.]|jgi:1-phosphofructokinase
MIYTVTFNPALDYIVSVKDFEEGKTNRTERERIFAGGKGINVSRVLNNLGVENTALGFIAGFTGKEIERRLLENGLKTDFIELKKGISRINIKLSDIEGTEINGRGPDIDEASLKLLSEKLDRLSDGDMLVLAGSVQASVSDSVYRDLMIRLSEKKVPIVVDATGELLLNVLEAKPFLIKPNLHELSEITGRELETKEEITEAAMELHEKGAANVLVSLGARGGILVDEKGRTYSQKAPYGKAVNAVGAGDSMVAGFIYAYRNFRDYEEAFKYSIASGSAGAFSQGFAEKRDIDELRERMDKE